MHLQFEQNQLQVMGPEFQQRFQQQQREQSAQQQSDQRLRREYQTQQMQQQLADMGSARPFNGTSTGSADSLRLPTGQPEGGSQAKYHDPEGELKMTISQKELYMPTCLPRE